MNSHEALGRLKQVAAALAPGFIELSRGVQTGYTQPTRAGLESVTNLLYWLLKAKAQNEVILAALVEEGMIKKADIDAKLNEAYEKTAVDTAAAINDNSLKLGHHPFQFQPVPPEPPKKKEGVS